MEPSCIHGDHSDVRTSLEVLPNNRATKIIIVRLHDQIHFYDLSSLHKHCRNKKKSATSLLNNKFSIKNSLCRACSRFLP